MNTRPQRIRAAMVAGLLVLAAGAGGVPAGCAMDRSPALRSRAHRIEEDLLEAQRQAMELPPGERDAKLEQLGTLRGTLAVANIARERIKDVNGSSARDGLYSMIEETYGLIEWRIGMPPGPEDAGLSKMKYKLENAEGGKFMFGGEVSEAVKPQGINGN